MGTTHDVKCWELAQYFLDGDPHTPEEESALAQVIQDAIEGWLEGRREKPYFVAAQPQKETGDAEI